jgi:hypothetical protein
MGGEASIGELKTINEAGRQPGLTASEHSGMKKVYAITNDADSLEKPGHNFAFNSWHPNRSN